MRAGRDIVASGTPLGQRISAPSQISTDASFTGNLFVHDDPNDLSLVQAGRDILYGNFNVAGPGTLEISAGRNILMEDRAAITSLGAVVPGDSRPGADIVLQAGAAGPTIRPSSSATWIRPTWRRPAPRWPSSRARWSGPTKASWPSG